MRTHLSREEIRHQVKALGPWFHNLDLDGVPTAPSHFLGDYPAVKWQHFSSAIAADLSGTTVLDIGCNGGFYSMEMKKRGAAHVVGIDSSEEYLRQAQFAARVNGLDIEFRHLSVYDIARIGEKFDIVLFMGVFYHLRHPLLALDLIHEHVAKDVLVFQSMQRGSSAITPIDFDYPFEGKDHFDDPGYPKLHFIEHRYAHDPTNWWVPNLACSKAMLRSAGFKIIEQPEEEVLICRRSNRPRGAEAVYPAQGTSP